MSVDWVRRDPLDAEVVRALLTTSWLGGEVEVHRSLTSTNDRARARARGGATAGLVVLAEEQTRGRGSGGRPWLSPPGTGIWMTALVAAPAAAPGLVTLGAGVAVVRAIGGTTGVAAALKWPNDVLAGGAKLCGILGEVLPERMIALGLGVNVHAAPPDTELERPAVALDQLAGRPVERNRLAAAILGEIEDVMVYVSAGSSARVLAFWRENCHHLGMRVRVSAGEWAVVGVAIDIEATGALLIRLDDDRVVPVVAGSLDILP